MFRPLFRGVDLATSNGLMPATGELMMLNRLLIAPLSGGLRYSCSPGARRWFGGEKASLLGSQFDSKQYREQFDTPLFVSVSLGAIL